MLQIEGGSNHAETMQMPTISLLEWIVDIVGIFSNEILFTKITKSMGE